MHLYLRRRRFATVAAAISLALLACRGLGSDPASSRAAAPSRIVLGWSGDAATSQAVTWRANARAATSQAQIGVAAAAGKGTIGPAASVRAACRAIRLDGGVVVTHCRADFTGLTPATTYAYRVGDGTSFSAWHRFTTASAGPGPFRFIYLGDAQNSLEKKWPPLARAALGAVPDARFVAYAGDLLENGYDDRLWGAFVAGLGARAAETPSVPAPGNHDLLCSPFFDASEYVLGVPLLWNAHFALPDNGPAELHDLAGQNYFIDYQGLRIVALDVNAFANRDFDPFQRTRVQDAQIRWLRRVLDTNPHRWTVVVQHQPVYSVSKDRDYAAMRAALGAVYDRYHVDLVLQGHDHAYARTRKVSGGRAAAPGAPGTIYVISVSGPKMYPIISRWEPLMAVTREGAQLYQVVSVSGERLSYESRTADGVLVDAFSLSRTPGAAPGGATILSEGIAGGVPASRLRVPAGRP